MKITAIHLYAIRLPLRDSLLLVTVLILICLLLSSKWKQMKELSVMVKALLTHHVTGESWESTFHTLKHTLAPALIGCNPMNIEKIHDMMDNTIYGVPTAKAAIDIACFDIMGKN